MILHWGVAQMAESLTVKIKNREQATGDIKHKQWEMKMTHLLQAYEAFSSH